MTWELWYRATSECPWVLAGLAITLALAKQWTRTQTNETRITMGLVIG